MTKPVPIKISNQNANGINALRIHRCVNPPGSPLISLVIKASITKPTEPRATRSAMGVIKRKAPTILTKEYQHEHENLLSKRMTFLKE